MRKASYIVIMAICALLTIQAACLASPAEVAVASVYGSQNTDPAKPLWHLIDGDPATRWATQAVDAGGEAWFVLKLSSPALLDYLEIAGLTGTGAGDVSIQYADEDGIWQPFLGRRHTALANGVLDLSWNRAITDRIRFVLHNSASAAVLGNIGEIKVFGRDLEQSIVRPSDVTASSENPGYKHSFLTDRNTYTAWRSADGANSAVVELTLDGAKPIDQVKFFVRGGAGLLNLSALVGGAWIPLGASMDLATLAAGWHAVDAGGVSASAVKFEITANGASYVGGLAEVEIWSLDAPAAKKTILLGENLAGSVTLGFDLDDLSAWNRAEIWAVLPAGSGTFTGNINGKDISSPYTATPFAGCALAQVPISLADLRAGRNVLRSDFNGQTVEEAVLVLYRDNGQIFVSGVSAGGTGLPGLFDGHLFTGGSTAADAIEIELAATAVVDAVRLHSSQTPGAISLSIWVNGAWIAVDPQFVTMDGSTLRIAGGTGATTKLRIQADSSFIASLTEVEVWGSKVNDGAPTVTISAPEQYAVTTQGSPLTLTGWVDNPDATVTVQPTAGQSPIPVQTQVHYFTCPLPVPAGGGITLDSASSHVRTGNISSISWPHTIGGGANRVLVVASAIQDQTAHNITNIRFNNVPMIEIAGSKAVIAGHAVTVLYYLPEAQLPPAGTYTVTITYDGQCDDIIAGAVSLANVRQTGPEAATFTAKSSSGTSVSTNITTLTGGAWLVDVLLAGDENRSLTPNTDGMVERWELEGDTATAACSTREAPFAGATAMSWLSNLSTARMLHSVAAFAPADSPNHAHTATVTATDSQNRTGQAVLHYNTHSAPGLTYDQTNPYYTNAAQVDITGTTGPTYTAVAVTINGVAAALNAGSYAGIVSLAEGENTIVVEATDAYGAAAGLERWVVRDSRAPEIRLAWPMDGMTATSPSLTVLGTCRDASPVTLTVNGQAVAVVNGVFSHAVTLVPGANTVTVVATDAVGNQKTVTAAVNYAVMGLTVNAPAEGTLFNTATVAVTGQVTGPYARVAVNGENASPDSGGAFSQNVTIADGQVQIVVEATGFDGTILAVTRQVTVDTTPPQEFSITVSPIGQYTEWINNNRPTFSFDTTDQVSGVDHYEIRIDGGAWITPVTSPYQFVDALADGEHSVEVKAVDVAGWERIAEVTVKIDTVAPLVPLEVKTISGDAEATLKWGPDSNDPIVRYNIRRTPVFTSGQTIQITGPVQKYVDEGLVNGTDYTYEIQAVDRAGNAGPWSDGMTITAGYDEVEYQPTAPATLAFADVEVVSPVDALPETCTIIAHSGVGVANPGPDPSEGITVVADPVLLGELVGDEVVDVEFDQPVTLTFSYDEADIPADCTAEDLHVYVYDDASGMWIRVFGEMLDPAAKTVTIQTYHFSMYQLAANPYAAPSLGGYEEEGPGPSTHYFKNHSETVSLESGLVTVNVTDIRIPGRNGMDLVFARRMGDSALLDINSEARNERVFYPGFGYWQPDLPLLESSNTHNTEYAENSPTLHLFGGMTATIGKWNITTGNNDLLYYEHHQDGLDFRIELKRHHEHKWFLIFRRTVWYTDEITVYMSDGRVIHLKSNGFFDYMVDRTGNNRIRAEYNDNKLSKLVDEATGNEIVFSYIGGKISTVACVGKQISFSMTGTSEEKTETVTEKVSATTNRVTNYVYTHKQQQDSNINTMALTRIEFPGGAKVEYTYEIQSRSAGESTRYKLVIKERSLTQREYDQSIEPVVSTTSYTRNYVNNSYVPPGCNTEEWTSNPFDHLTYATITEVNKTITQTYTVFVPNMGGTIPAGYVPFTYNGRKDINAYYQLRKVLCTTWTDGREKVIKDYYMPSGLLKEETHYRVSSSNEVLAYSIEYTYDNWGNMTSRKNSGTGLEEYYAYANTSAASLPVIEGLQPQPNPYISNINPLIHNLPLINVSLWRKNDAVESWRQQAWGYDADGSPAISGRWYNEESRWIATEYDCDEYGNIEVMREPLGKTTNLYYDAHHAYLVAKTVSGLKDADGADLPPVSTYYGYYPTGERKWEIDPRGFVTTYKYDIFGRTLEVCYPDAYEEPVADPLNYAYAVRPGNPLRTYTYDDAGDCTTVINEEGYISEFYYDGLGHLVRVERIWKGDPPKPPAVVKFGYDAQWNVNSVTDAKGNIITYDYDSFKRITELILPRDDSDELFTGNPKADIAYDDLDNICTITDPSNGTRVDQYDAAGRLVNVKLGTDNEQIEVEFDYDGFGNRTREEDPRGGETCYSYDSLGRLVKVELPRVNVWNHDTGSAEPITPTVTYAYNDLGQKISETNPRGNTTAAENDFTTFYTYDVLGRLLSTTAAYTDGFDGTPEPVTITTKNYYDAAGNVHRAVDGKGNEVMYEYYPRGWLKKETRARDEEKQYSVLYTYDKLGRKISVTDPRGTKTPVENDFTTWFEYDGLGRLYKTILPDETLLTKLDNAYEELTFDLNGNVTAKRDANNHTTTIEYNVRNLPWKAIDPLENEVKTYYGPSGEKLLTVDATGKKVKYVYNSLGLLKETILDPDPGGLQLKTSYTYDENGNRDSVKDPNEHTTFYDYDDHNRLTQVTQPVGKNQAGQVITKRTFYYYDACGNQVLTIQETEEGLWQETLGGISVTPTGIHPTLYYYDELNRLIKMERWAGGQVAATEYAYDLAGNRSHARDPNGNASTYAYYLDNLLRRFEIDGPNGTYFAEYDYDPAGNRVEVRDSGNTNRYNFEDGIYQDDPRNRLNSVERTFDDPVYTYRTEYRYDASGLLTGIKYPGAEKWLGYGYDNANRLVSVEYGEFNQGVWVKDQNGNFTGPAGIEYYQNGLPEKVHLANGVTTSYFFDSANRLQNLTVGPWDDPIFRQTYEYDKNGNIEKIIDGAREWEYEYDWSNQLIYSKIPTTAYLETRPTPGQPGIMMEDYLGAKPLFFPEHPEAVDVTLDYASSSIGLDFGEVVPGAKMIRLLPDTAGLKRLHAKALDVYWSADNATYHKLAADDWTFTKNLYGVVTITLNEKKALRYIKIHVKFDDRSPLFEFVAVKSDFLNKLAAMIEVYQEADTLTEEFEYDLAGNRLRRCVTRIIDTAETVYRYYKHCDRLMEEATGDTGCAYKYDANGNLIAKGNRYTIDGETVTFTATSGEGVEYWEYVYSPLNRLIMVKRNGIIKSEYGYDPEGIRVWKRASGKTIHYIFEGTEPILEKRITDGITRSYIHALNKYFARVDGNIGNPEADIFYYHTDHLGSLRAVTNGIGAVVWRADYKAFGERYNQDGEFEERHGFTGKEYDEEAGLYYFDARWYDPGLGKFISEDSYIGNIDDPRRLNRYTYSGNNPLRYIDLTGYDFTGPELTIDGEEEESGLELNGIFTTDFGIGSEMVIDDEGFNPLDWVDPEYAEEIAYYLYWADRNDPIYYSDPLLIDTALQVMWMGIDRWGESAMPAYGWGIDPGFTDPFHMNQVRTIQAVLGVKVDGQYGGQTRSALKDQGYSHYGQRVGQRIIRMMREQMSQRMAGWYYLALLYLGTPYILGATDPPKHFDCGLYVQWIYKYAFGVDLPRTVRGIVAITLEIDQPFPGCIIVFDKTYDYTGDGIPDPTSHVGIWLGGNQFIHAGSKGVAVKELTGYYKEHFGSFRAYPGLEI